VIMKTRRQRFVGGEHGDHFGEQAVQSFAVSAGLRTPIVPLISPDRSNRPH
jgi:hypothetical protein